VLTTAYVTVIKKLLYGPQNTTRKLFTVLKQEVYNHILFDKCIIKYSHSDSTFTTWWHNPCYATKRQCKLWPTCVLTFPVTHLPKAGAIRLAVEVSGSYTISHTFTLIRTHPNGVIISSKESQTTQRTQTKDTGFEPTISAIRWPHTHASYRTVIGGRRNKICLLFRHALCMSVGLSPVKTGSSLQIFIKIVKGTFPLQNIAAPQIFS
jgi:hypothetical protein